MKMAIDKVISSLPLEFRGTDPVSCLRGCLRARLCPLIHHRHYVAIWRWSSNALWAVTAEVSSVSSSAYSAICGHSLSSLLTVWRYAVIEMIVPPDLNQARVNKCLIALVNRKIVTKDNSTVGGKNVLIGGICG